MTMVADIPIVTRARFSYIDLHHTRMSPQLIATEVKSSRHFVRNVLRDYDMNSSSMPSTQKSIKNYKN